MNNLKKKYTNLKQKKINYKLNKKKILKKKGVFID